MSMHKTVGKLQAIAFLLLGCLPVAADTVYKTVDDKGVVSFSDIPPEGDPEVESFQIATPPPQDAEVAQQRLEDMRETTDRMASDRREREKHRAEMQELQATAPQQQHSSNIHQGTTTTIHPSIPAATCGAGTITATHPGDPTTGPGLSILLHGHRYARGIATARRTGRMATSIQVQTRS